MTTNVQPSGHDTSVIMAAGGILERITAKGPKIAVIYRERYGSEWCLPKGKLKLGESLEQGALREIEEETGCTARIKRFAGASNYLVKDGPKIVVYWIMEPVGECNFKPTDEVLKLEWLSPEDAITRVAHDNQKSLIEDVYLAKTIDGKPSKLASTKGALAQFVFARKKWQRLASSISAYREELTGHLKRDKSWEKGCICTAYRLLDMAEKDLKEGNIDKGWKHFHTAQRMETLSLDKDTHKAQLKATVVALRQEIGKLKKWRQQAAQKLLGEGDHIPNVEDVYQAQLLRDEHYSNQSYKAGLIQQHVFVLCTILLILAAAFIAIAKLDILVLAPTTEAASSDVVYRLFVGVALFGLLGGTLSGVLSVPESTESTRIPELTATIRVTMLRLIMGAGMAIIVVVFMKSELAGMFSKNIAEAIKDATPYTIYAIAFVAGFTERLVLRAVEFLAGK